MSKYLLLYLLSAITIIPVALETEFEPAMENDVAVEEGKRQYTALSRESQVPKYGSCWKNALLELHVGCKHLTDDTQSRLALGFTNCFLLKSGIETRACKTDEEISDCVQFLNIKGYTTYTNFFTHTHSMCVFLQTQIWHEETGKVIVKLNENSVNVTRQLEKSQGLQIQLMKNQKKSIEAQEKLWSKGNELTRVLETSKENVKEVMYEFKSSTEEQRQIILNIFERVASLQSILLSEFTGFYSILYHVLSACGVYLITSTARTRDARFWLFLVLVVNFVCERLIVAWGIDGEDYVLAKDIEVTLHDRQWNCRKISIAIAAAILYIVIWRFRDFNKINNQLLMDIKQQNLELKKFILENKIVGNSTIGAFSGGDAILNGTNNSELCLNMSSEPSVPKFASTPIKRTPLKSRTESPSRRYNLRARRSLHTSAVQDETPDEFYDYVRDLEMKSKQASVAIRSSLRNKTPI